MGGRREAGQKARSHLVAMLAEEQALLHTRAVRAQRRERRRQIRQEDASLADALNAVSVGTEAKQDAPKIGAPLKKDIEMKSVKVARPRIRKRCKKCQQRLNKIRARMAKRAASKMNIDTVQLPQGATPVVATTELTTTSAVTNAVTPM